MFIGNKLWFFVLITVFGFAFIVFALEEPYGKVSGQIAIKREGYGIALKELKKNDKVYALVSGPNFTNKGRIERGVWVKPDGKFVIERLPVGEYTLRVKAPGFSSFNQYGIYVQEAKNTFIKNIVLEPQETYGTIASNTRVFTSKETPYFWINSNGGTKAEINIYQTDILKLLQTKNPDIQIGYDLRLYKPNQNPKQILNQAPVQTLERKLYPDYNDWSRTEIKLNKTLPKGDYIIALDLSNEAGKHDFNWSWFSVTDKGLIIKHAPDRTIVKAVDLLSLKPIKNLVVQFFDESKKLAKSKTDTNGFVEVKVPKEYKQKANYNWLIYSVDGEDKIYGGVPYWGGETESYKTYFYTEKPVYRLGQTVYYKAITRLVNENGLQLPKAGTKVQITVENPDGEQFAEYTSKLNQNGTFNGLVEIPTEGKTGAYSLKFTFPDGSYSYGSFEIAQYKKPEYKVEVTPLQKKIIAGNKFKAKISANYFFGAPVKNARVKYTIYTQTDWLTRYKLSPRPSYYSYYDDWDDNYYDENYNGDYLTEGTAITDENGIAEIEVSTEAIKNNNTDPFSDEFYDKNYKIQAEVTDLSRMTVTGSGSVLVTPGNYILFVNPTKYIYSNGDQIEAKVTAIDYEGKPLENKKISLYLSRWKYNPKKNTYSEEIVVNASSAETDEKGIASFNLKTKDNFASETYYLTAKGDGSNVVGKNTVWISNENSRYILSSEEAKGEAVSIKLDKSVYKPGESAKVLINAPVTGKEGIQALVSVEGNKLHEYYSIPLTASAITIDIPVKPEYKPNAYVSVALVAQNHQLYTQSVMLKVTPEESFLNLSIKTEKIKYKPGETINYEIQALNSLGQPVKGAELSLGVVDESIYSIRPEVAEDIKKYFYQRVENRVLTLSSFPEQYSGGPDKFEPKLRKEFKDTAAWIPSLITDANGIAKASIKLPDNLTSWRATVRAATPDSCFGWATQNIISTQDIIARLALPRFFTQYDQSFLTGIVHNYSDKEQEVNLSLRTSEQFKVNGNKSIKLKIPSGEAKRQSWKVKVLSSGEGVVSLTALAENNGDALEQKLPINPLGLPVAFSQNGIITKPEESIELKLENIPNSEINLSVAASPLAGALGNLEKLIDYPYGCTEQTMSRLMPAVIAEQVSKNLKVVLPEETINKIEEVKKQALLKLTDYQHENGAWGWWKEDSDNLYLTAYVLEGLYYLQNPSNEAMVQKGLTWLKIGSETLRSELDSPKRLIENYDINNEKLIDLAQSDYVISLYEGDKHFSKKINQFWTEHLNKLTPEALSFVVLAFPEQELAKNAFERLETLINKKSNYYNWDYSAELLKKLNLKEVYTYRFSGVESTALALRAAVKMQYKETDSIIAWLILQRDKDGWNNTKTTAQVLKALTEYSLQSGNGENSFKVLSNVFDSLTFDSSNTFKTEIKFNWKELSKIPKATIQLVKSGAGKLYYWVLQSYYKFLRPGEKIHNTSLPKELKLTRNFYKLKKQLVDSDKIVFTSEPLFGAVKSGEIVLMKLKVDTPTALPYIMLEAPLPSGAEVLIKDPRNELLEDNAIEGDWGDYWWTHQDVLDDKIVFFVTNLPAGKHEFNTLIRTELPGEFNLNPFRLEGMYTKLIRANSELNTLKVTD